MNSSPGPLNSDPFDILEESRSTVYVYGVSTRPMSSPESTGGQYTITVEVNNLTSSTDENRPESPMTSLPLWDIMTIEAVGNPSIFWQTRSQEKYGNVVLMEHVLDTCDPDIYVDG